MKDVQAVERAYSSFPSVGIVALAIAFLGQTPCCNNVINGRVATNDTVKELGEEVGRKLACGSWTTEVHAYYDNTAGSSCEGFSLTDDLCELNQHGES